MNREELRARAADGAFPVSQFQAAGAALDRTPLLRTSYGLSAQESGLTETLAECRAKLAAQHRELGVDLPPRTIASRVSDDRAVLIREAEAAAARYERDLLAAVGLSTAGPVRVHHWSTPIMCAADRNAQQAIFFGLIRHGARLMTCHRTDPATLALGGRPYRERSLSETSQLVGRALARRRRAA